MRIQEIMNILRLKLNILIINPSQIPVISATGLVKKPQRVRKSQFIMNVHKYTWTFYYCDAFWSTRHEQLKVDVEYQGY